MKLVELRLTNYRAYKEETVITFEDLTILIGKNDAGKSSVMDALNTFFNGESIDRDDASVSGDPSCVRIACAFSELPAHLVLDDRHPTTLAGEFLLRRDGRLQICKTYNLSATKSKVTTTALASHPSEVGYDDLLELKNKDLKDRAKKLGVDMSGVNQGINAELRAAIWRHAPELKPNEREIGLASETGKAVWDQLQLFLPTFALFKSDRPSTDQDQEAQDPMKAAIKEAIRAHEAALNGVVGKVKAELESFVKKTVEKIQEMSPDLAHEMNPQIKNKNWDSLFSVSLTGDEGVPINKRGSGTRRLVLLNFFRARAEESSASKGTGVLYAIEEPETSQHPNHQIMLLDAFQSLVASSDCQIILTTHTPTLARRVDRNCLRMISREGGRPTVLNGKDDSTLGLIKETLGVLPDHDIKAFLGVEGKWDICFLKHVSKMLAKDDPTIPDLGMEEEKGALVFVPLGGSSMELWTHRLAKLDRDEFYITDRDTPPPGPPKYDCYLQTWKARPRCKAWCTSKRELENYIHPELIKAIARDFPDKVGDFDDVPLLVAQANHMGSNSPNAWDALSQDKQEKKIKQAKVRLNDKDCAGRMTRAHLAETDPQGEIIGWLKEIGRVLV